MRTPTQNKTTTKQYMQAMIQWVSTHITILYQYMSNYDNRY
jgi:hypothetical protein